MAATRFVEVTDKEKSPKKTQKTCVKILKQLFASGRLLSGNIHLDFVSVNIPR
jgi:hypothetical protein